MLDDLKYIHQKDAQDTLGIAERQCRQLEHEFDLSNANFHDIQNVVFAGMGGSAVPATYLQTWPTIAVPFEIVDNYDLPSYVGPQTLCILSSYSGNTEETLSALEQAVDKGAQIAVMASGGQLQTIAKQKGYPFALIPKAEQPRYAVLYDFKALLTILDRAGLVDLASLMPELLATRDFVGQAVRLWRADVPTANNPAKQLAQELLGRSLVIYAGPKMYPAAHKWKISCNENAKQIAWYGQLPEFSHNEFIGWSEQPINKPYAVIDLRSNLEHPRVQKRFVVGARLLSGLRPAPIIVKAEGKTVFQQLLWTITFGDFVTLYLGLLNGLNPAPVDLVEKLKKALDA